MRVFSLLVSSLGIAYTVYSSDTNLKAKLQKHGLHGDLWMHPDIDSNFDGFGNNKYSVFQIKTLEECAFQCTQTEDCMAFTLQFLCRPDPWACRLVLKPGFDSSLNALKRAKHFTKQYSSGIEVQGAFYRPDNGAYHLMIGTLMVTYKTLADLINGKPGPVKQAGSLFPHFGKNVDDVLVQQDHVDTNNSHLLFHLINHNKCHTYRLDSSIGPAVKVTAKKLVFPNMLESVDAAVELNCGSSSTHKTYFLLDGEHVYEAPGNTWLHSEDGTFHGNKTFSGSPFPAELTAVTAAEKYAGSDEALILFEGLKFYHYNIANNLLQSLGEVDLCR